MEVSERAPDLLDARERPIGRKGLENEGFGGARGLVELEKNIWRPKLKAVLLGQFRKDQSWSASVPA